jgi:RimJ/RimL family protein N-acetyltransferase
MQYMLTTLDRRESDALAGRIRQQFVHHGFGLWAVELIGIADFIGFTGFSVPSFEAHFTPCVEIAWRLARDYWGFGYATEAARAARDYGFAQLGLRQIVSFGDGLMKRREPRPAFAGRGSLTLAMSYSRTT